MKGVRFYEELHDKNRKNEKSQGTVVAVMFETARPDGKFGPAYDAVGALFYNEPNSVVCGTSVCQDYLTQITRRVSEERAREIHPELFRYLEGSVK